MWSRIRILARGIFHRQSMEDDMAAEMESHLAARTDDLIRRGLPPVDAARQARLEFGGAQQYREECREARGWRFIDECFGDLRYAFRQYRRSSLFASLSIAVLAIGIGANTALFSAIDAVMLRMLPVPHPEQLREIQWTSPKAEYANTYSGRSAKGASGEDIYFSVSYPVYQYLRDHSSSWSGLFAFGDAERLNITVQGLPELASGQKVSGNYFTGLQSGAFLGRTLLPEDDRIGQASSVAVMSYGYWQRRFASDRNILGRTFIINGVPDVIVGVMPKGWCGVNPVWCPDLVLPLSQGPLVDGRQNLLDRPDFWGFEVMGRLAPGVTPQHAAAEAELLIRQKIRDYHPRQDYDPPRVSTGFAGHGIDRLRRTLKQPLTLLAWALASVLLIACANIGGLLLSRAAARQREIATRLALGAGRSRLIRQLITETLLLAALGSTAGLLLAAFAVQLMARLSAANDQPLGVTIELNLRVLSFSAGLCLLTGLVLGLAPALHAARGDLQSSLKTSGAAVHRSRFLAGKLLVAVQVVFALVLSTGSALFVRTLINLRSEPLGFRPDHLLTFQLDPTMNGYRNARLLNFHEEAVRRFTAIPGVSSASMSRWGILSGNATGDNLSAPDSQPIHVHIHYVSPRFFETLGFPLLAGRDVTFADREQSKPVAIVNQALVRKLFPDQNPLGRTVKLDNDIEIVGVAADTKFDNLKSTFPPTIYIPFRQEHQFSMTYVIRTATDPRSLLPALRQAVRALDPNVPLFDVKTQEEQASASVRNERLCASLLSGFAGMSLLLACLGIYSTLAWQVARRTPEIGVRMALGAQRTSVMTMVMRESLAPVLFGLAVGVLAALASGRLVQSMLFGLQPNDPATFLTVALALLLSALAAAWAPARKASRIPPMQALRYE